jgi:hypothetical protein
MAASAERSGVGYVIRRQGISRCPTVAAALSNTQTQACPVLLDRINNGSGIRTGKIDTSAKEPVALGNAAAETATSALPNTQTITPAIFKYVNLTSFSM